MKSQDYSTFFKEVIKKCMNGIESEIKKEFSGLECFRKNKNNYEKAIFRNYQKKRDYIKYNYMSKKNPIALDRHKVASCMVYAILKANPFKINMWIPNLPEKVVLANEYLAFFVALNIMEMYKNDEISDLNHQRIDNGLDELNEKYQIIVPKTYHEVNNPENTYESNLCKAWYYIKIDNIEKFDVLAYANVFFLLQKYTDLYLQFEETKK